MIKLNSIIVVNVLSVMAGCKPAPTSSVQSLDNFAAGTRIRDNICSSNKEMKINDAFVAPFRVVNMSKKIDGAAEEFRAVVLSMSALPKSMLDKFSTFNGIVILSDSPETYCSHGLLTKESINFAKDGLKNIESCFLLQYKDGGSSDRLENGREVQELQIVMSADTKVIYHSTIRQLGYIYSQLFSQLEPKENKTFQLKLRSKSDNEDRARLARSFLLDLSSPKNSKLFKLTSMSPYLGDNFPDVLKKHRRALERGDDVDFYNDLSFSFSGTPKPKTKLDRHKFVERFKDFVVAEAFDSFYCNNFAPYSQEKILAAQRDGNLNALGETDNTYEVMKDIFPQTFRSFAKIGKGNTDTTALRLAGDDQTFAQWVGESASYVNQNYNPGQVILRKSGAGLQSVGDSLNRNGWTGLGTATAVVGGFSTGIADSTDAFGQGIAQTVANPAEAYRSYYKDTSAYSTNTINRQADEKGMLTTGGIAAGTTLSGLHILGPGKVHEGARGQLYDGTEITDPLEQAKLINAGITETAGNLTGFKGGVEFGNRLAYKAGLPQATKPISSLVTGNVPVNPTAGKFFGNATPVSPNNIKAWEWADDGSGAVRRNPTVESFTPNASGQKVAINVPEGQTRLFAVVEDATAPKGYKINVFNEEVVGKQVLPDGTVQSQGLGHPTGVVGERPLFGGEISNNGGVLQLNNKSGRLVGQMAETNPGRVLQGPLKIVESDFRTMTGSPTRTEYFAPKLADGSFAPSVTSGVTKPSSIPASAGVGAVGAQKATNTDQN